MPGRAKQVRVIEHRPDALGIIYWASLRQPGTLQQIHEVGLANSAGVLVSDVHLVAVLYCMAESSKSHTDENAHQNTSANEHVSDDDQPEGQQQEPPMTFDLSLSEPVGSR